MFIRICIGKFHKAKGFKINPDTWSHPDTTKSVVKLLKENYQIAPNDDLPSSVRMSISHFIKYGLKIPLEQDERTRLGLGGHKDSMGEHATASLIDNQYDKALQYCKEHNLLAINQAKYPTILLFGVHFHTFVRPSVLFTIRLDQIFFFDRTIEFIESDGIKKIIAVTHNNKKTIPDQALYNIIKQNNVPTKLETTRACFLKDVLEFKTTGKKKARSKWPKFINDEKIVIPLEKFTESRLHRGKKYLFFEDNKVTFDVKGSPDFNNYRKFTDIPNRRWGAYLKGLFRSIGCVDKVFYQNSTYSMRHIGVQYWCELTDYNYPLIAEMGWNDIETLRIFYARRTQSNMAERMAQVIG